MSVIVVSLSIGARNTSAEVTVNKISNKRFEYSLFTGIRSVNRVEVMGEGAEDVREEQ